MIRNFLGKLKLSNFLNSRVMDIENDEGEIEKGIFIPIDINCLYLSPRNQVIAWVFINEKIHDMGDGYSHYFKLKTSKNHLEKINSMGYKTPYLGGMKESSYRISFQENAFKTGNERVGI